jgi:dTDP-4-amino-4,6-dideoxygalactose transaminase
MPPAWSPVTLAALWKGGRAAIGDGSRHTEALRAELAGRLGANEVILTDSGTSALALALGDRLGDRGPVAMPCYSCFDLATAATQADVEVFLYDLNPTTLRPDLASLERALAAGAKRVVVVHLFGFPVDVESVMELCRRFEAVVVEDAAQAFGASFGSRPAGSLGAISILSFNRGKGVTGGGGGALVGFGRGAAPLRALGSTLRPSPRRARPLLVAAAQWLFGRPRLYSIPRALPFLHMGQTVYRPPRPPARMAATSAALVLRAMSLAELETAVRRSNAEWLRTALAGQPDLVTVDPHPDSEPSYLRLPVLLRGRARETAEQKGRRLGIAPGYPRLLRDLKPLAPRIRNAGDSFPGGMRLVGELHTCPTHGWLADTDLGAIRDLFRIGGA